MQEKENVLIFWCNQIVCNCICHKFLYREKLALEYIHADLLNAPLEWFKPPWLRVLTNSQFRAEPDSKDNNRQLWHALLGLSDLLDHFFVAWFQRLLVKVVADFFYERIYVIIPHENTVQLIFLCLTFLKCVLLIKRHISEFFIKVIVSQVNRISLRIRHTPKCSLAK